MKGFLLTQKQQHGGPSLSPSCVWQEGPEPCICVTPQRGDHAKSELSGPTLERARRSTHSYGNSVSSESVRGQRAVGASGQDSMAAVPSTGGLLYTQVPSHRRGHPPEQPGRHPSILICPAPSPRPLPRGTQYPNCAQTL